MKRGHRYSFLRFSRTVIGTLPLKIFENSIACLQKRCKEGKKILNGLDKTIQNAAIATRGVKRELP